MTDDRERTDHAMNKCIAIVGIACSCSRATAVAAPFVYVRLHKGA